MRKARALLLLLLLAAPAGAETAKPRVYWWWFAGEIRREDVRAQLEWLKSQGLGGALIFFLYPADRKKDAPRYPLFGDRFTALVTDTKKQCGELGLACDFLLGTGWPYGGTFVSRRDAAELWTDQGLRPLRTFRVSWEWPKPGYVLDHLSAPAFDRYFFHVSKAFAAAARLGARLYLECDSWEIGSPEPVWTEGFARLFARRYGYSILPYVAEYLPSDPRFAAAHAQWPYLPRLYAPGARLGDVRYDYFKLVSDLVLDNFYRRLTRRVHELGAGTIVEANGAPADIIDAYAAVDRPMTEAILYEPRYARIPASAAALTGRPIVPSETFTCAYGWPDKLAYKEQLADLKLIADAVFANGANLIYWHGFALNARGSQAQQYYATVHVGPRSKLMKGFAAFNGYLERVSSVMQRGRTLTDVAVYLPTEDRWEEGAYTQDEFARFKPEELNWHFGKYEMRYERFPRELEGRPMLWINGTFLRSARFSGGRLLAGKASFRSLYVDARFLPLDTLRALRRLAERRLPVCLRRDPLEPGTLKHPEYRTELAALKALSNVSADPRALPGEPLVSGADLPEFWARRDGASTFVFFENPKAKALTYPLRYGQGLQEGTLAREVVLRYGGRAYAATLRFAPAQSLLYELRDGRPPRPVDVRYFPPPPALKP